MKTAYLACMTLLGVALLPSVASAGGGDRYRGHHGGHRRDNSSFSFSFGYGSGGYGGYSHVGFGYGRGYGNYYRPAPVVVAPYYAPP